MCRTVTMRSAATRKGSRLRRWTNTLAIRFSATMIDSGFSVRTRRSYPGYVFAELGFYSNELSPHLLLPRPGLDVVDALLFPPDRPQEPCEAVVRVLVFDRGKIAVFG